MYEYNAVILHITDGDTVKLDIDVGLRIHCFDTVRLSGINTPEMNTDLGKTSKKILERIIPVGTKVRIKTKKDRKGKYGRWLATIYKGRFNVNKYMLRYGHAKEY